MREVCLIVGMLFVANVSHAGALTNILGGSSAGREMLGVVMNIFAIGVIGWAGSALLSVFGKARFGNLFEKGCYMAAFALFFGTAINVVNQFINLFA